jgi:hypothetical protein
MQKPTTRYIVAAVLIAAAGIGGFFVFDAHRRAASLDAAQHELSTRIDRMITAAGNLAAAQQAYVAPGQPQQPWFERSTALLQQFGQEQAAIRPMLQSPDARAALGDIDTHFKAIVVIDEKAHGYLQEEQNLLAADLIFSEGHDTIDMLVTMLRMLAQSEQQTAVQMRAAAERQQWGTLAAIAVIWIAGLVLLTPSVEPANQDSGLENVALSHRALANPAPQTSAPPVSPAVTVDLAAAAEVCGALARTTEADSLHNALTRAAAVLGARGIIVWMGAGEELFPALAYGYDDRMVARLGPIQRNAANATATAWRSAQMRTVPADRSSHGALAAPISGAGGCIGVFAAELTEGREQDASTRAVAVMFAAQLAAIVPAWPAPSTSHSVAASGG